MSKEMWRDVVGFPSYKVSSMGGVIHKSRPNTVRKVALNHQGFPTLVLFKEDHTGSRYVRQLNKLVAEAFIGHPPNGMNSIWHIDGDLTNCSVKNLRWEMRSRVMEWNEMHRTGTPKFKTPPVRVNSTGVVYSNAYECAMHEDEIESAVIVHIEKYPEQYADRAKYRYLE